MTTTTAHLVNRIDIDTGATFDELRQRYERLVPTIDFAELTDLIEAGDLARVQQYTAAHAPHSFVNFWTFDPTPMMRLVGHQHPGDHLHDGQQRHRGNDVSPRSRCDAVRAAAHRDLPKTPTAAPTSGSTNRRANSLPSGIPGSPRSDCSLTRNSQRCFT